MHNGQEPAQTAPSPAPMGGGRGMLRLLWAFWQAYGEQVAFYQTTVILTVIYIVVVGPIWLIGRLTGHAFLPILPRSAAGFWHPTHMGGDDQREWTKQG